MKCLLNLKLSSLQVVFHHTCQQSLLGTFYEVSYPFDLEKFQIPTNLFNHLLTVVSKMPTQAWKWFVVCRLLLSIIKTKTIFLRAKNKTSPI